MPAIVANTRNIAIAGWLTNFQTSLNMDSDDESFGSFNFETLSKSKPLKINITISAGVKLFSASVVQRFTAIPANSAVTPKPIVPQTRCAPYLLSSDSPSISKQIASEIELTTLKPMVPRHMKTTNSQKVAFPYMQSVCNSDANWHVTLSAFAKSLVML